MKKIVSVLLCAVIICLSFTGCAGRPNADMTEENINATVDTAVAALKDFDIDRLEKYVDSSTLSVILGYAEKHGQFADLGKAIFENLTYEVTAVDTDAATVTLSVKNKDLYEPASDFTQELKDNYTTLQLLSKITNDDFLDRKLGELCDLIDAAELQSDNTEITLSIETADDNLVLIFDETAENAVSGGALTAVKQIYS